MRSRILPVFVPHLGCPFDCVFCNQKRIAGASTPAAAETVAAEIRSAPAFLRQGAQLAFYGGSFTAIPAAEQETLLESAGPFLDLHPTNSLRVSTRPDAVSGEALERLRRFGVETVELGVQSMDPEVLERSGRGHGPGCVAPAVALLRRYGFEVILQMMTGLPGDTRARSRRTAEAIAGLAPDGVRIYPTVVVRDTPLEDMYRRGEYRPHTVEEAVEWCAELVPLFVAARIPIVRLGLNPTEDLSGGGVVAGAYHPALGQLVYSRVYFHRALPLLRPLAGAQEVVLGVPRRDISTVVGQRRENVEKLQRELGIGRIRITGREIGQFSVEIVSHRG